LGAKWTKQPPLWFNFRDYRSTSKLNFLGWANMLWIRARYRPLPAAPVSPAVLWELYLEDSRLKNAELEIGLEFPSGIATPRSIILNDITNTLASLGVDQNQFKLFHYVKGLIDLDIQLMGYRVLLVNPQASDEVLLTSFPSWIQKIREQRPLGIRRRGRKTINKAISVSDFESWSRYQILAVLDLDFHAELFGEPKLSYAALADVLRASSEVDATEWGRAARKKAKYALGCAEVLLSQAQAGMK
jgi:hypothetical protein